MQPERYDHVECRKSEGAHYTPENLANFVAAKIVQTAKSKPAINIVDPAVGDGELLLRLVDALSNTSSKVEVFGFDTNPGSIEITRTRLNERFPDIHPNLIHADFLEVCLQKNCINGTSSLFQDSGIPDFDLLIANPPYIRTQVLGAKQAQLLSRTFGLKGRVDIYQAFLVAMRAVLKPDAIAGVIVSNRFLTTKGASALREKLISDYNLLNIWDFGDTKLFEAAVLPAVVLLSPGNNTEKHQTRFSSVYESTRNGMEVSLDSDNPIDALDLERKVRLTNGITYKVRHGILTYDTSPKDVWRLQDKISSNWLNSVKNHTWAQFKDIGKIRVGVKTTADKVFIRKDWDKETGFVPELVRPLTSHHVANQYSRLNKPLKYILYTHEVRNGKRQPVEIAKYALSNKYLEQNRDALEKRHYVIEAGRNWWEIWVPQDPSLWKKEKIVFKDIAEQPTFWMDLEETVVNGDCFWLVQDNETMPGDILFLVLAVANSAFIIDFYDVKFHNKLYSNRRRFITQYVEQFPIPDPSLPVSRKLASLARKLVENATKKERNRLREEINHLVREAFSVEHIDPMD